MMNVKHNRRERRAMRNRPARSAMGFTLIELLVVICVISILASMLLGVLSSARRSARETMAKTEMKALAAAIHSYRQAKEFLPVTRETNAKGKDLTFGLPGRPNAEVMTILLGIDDQARPAERPQGTFNAGARINAASFWSPERVTNTRHGFSLIDYEMRDPWGRPYLITLDLDDDGKTVDQIYGRSQVSSRGAGIRAGYHGLYQNDGGLFEANTGVMIWSLGADGNREHGAFSLARTENDKANVPLNRDNVVGW